jgi:DNA/RNA endonuclease YhcR with UshA esterase domain
MFLSSTRRMKVLKRLEIEELKLAEISEKNLNQTLMIKNVEIIKTNKYTIGQNITLKDESGELPLNVFDSDLAKIQDIGVKQALTSKGSKITFKGVVKQYKGNLQLALASPSDSSSIIINSAGKNEKGIEKTVILSPIGEINENFLNKTVTIEGVVEKIINTTAGRILTLKEEDSSITVWIPSKMPLTNEIKESSKLQIKGKVTSYRDNIQVVPFGTDCVINL